MKKKTAPFSMTKCTKTSEHRKNSTRIVLGFVMQTKKNRTFLMDDRSSTPVVNHEFIICFQKVPVVKVIEIDGYEMDFSKTFPMQIFQRSLHLAT